VQIRPDKTGQLQGSLQVRRAGLADSGRRGSFIRLEAWLQRRNHHKRMAKDKTRQDKTRPQRDDSDSEQGQSHQKRESEARQCKQLFLEADGP